MTVPCISETAPVPIALNPGQTVVLACGHWRIVAPADPPEALALCCRFCDRSAVIDGVLECPSCKATGTDRRITRKGIWLEAFQCDMCGLLWTVRPDALFAASAGTARAEPTAWQRMEVENARKLIIDLEAIGAAQLAGPLGAYWAGRLEGAVRNLLDIIDYVTVTP